MNVLRFLSVMLTAVSMSAGLAHLFELPNKIDLPRDAYLTVQQIYRGWALLGIAVIGALLSTGALAVLERRGKRVFYPTLIAALCIAASLAVFFVFTYPTNQATRNWTFLPDNWEALRRQWEYSHATGSALYFVALSSLVISLLRKRPLGGRAAGELTAGGR